MKTKFLKLLFILMLMLSFSFLPFKAYAEDISTTDTIKGGFEIKVLVDGDSTPNADAEFEFTITKDGVAAVGTYSIDHASSLAIPSDGKIKLKANQIATLNDLPVKGSWYRSLNLKRPSGKFSIHIIVPPLLNCV